MCIKCFACSDLRQTPNLFSNGVKTGEEKDLQIFQQIKATRRGGVWVLRVLTSQHVSIEREKPSHRSTLPNILFLKKLNQSTKGTRESFAYQIVSFVAHWSLVMGMELSGNCWKSLWQMAIALHPADTFSCRHIRTRNQTWASSWLKF